MPLSAGVYAITQATGSPRPCNYREHLVELGQILAGRFVTVHPEPLPYREASTVAGDFRRLRAEALPIDGRVDRFRAGLGPKLVAGVHQLVARRDGLGLAGLVPEECNVQSDVASVPRERLPQFRARPRDVRAPLRNCAGCAGPPAGGRNGCKRESFALRATVAGRPRRDGQIAVSATTASNIGQARELARRFAEVAAARRRDR